jgi:hypothetical protein
MPSRTRPALNSCMPVTGGPAGPDRYFQRGGVQQFDQPVRRDQQTGQDQCCRCDVADYHELSLQVGGAGYRSGGELKPSDAHKLFASATWFFTLKRVAYRHATGCT